MQEARVYDARRGETVIRRIQPRFLFYFRICVSKLFNLIEEISMGDFYLGEEV